MVYVAGSRLAGEAVAIDPAWDVERILAAATGAGLRITGAVVTHAHDDHVHGLEALVQVTGAAVFAHHLDAGELRRTYAGTVTEVEHGDRIALGDLVANILHTPGHTPGSLCLLAGEALFTGDTLMVGSAGRHGAWEGAEDALLRSLCSGIAPLPDSTVLHPGHDSGPHPSSTLGAERARVPALSAASFDELIRSRGR